MAVKTLDSSVLLTHQTKLPIQIAIHLTMIDPSTIDLSALPSVAVADRHLLPDVSAVYFVISPDGDVVYVGKSENIQKRWQNHHHAGSCAGCFLAWIECNSLDLYSTEYQFISFYQPALNSDASIAFTSTENSVARLRHIVGISQHDLARHLGVTVGTVSKWEQGINKAKFDSDQILVLDDLLSSAGTSLKQFLQSIAA